MENVTLIRIIATVCFIIVLSAIILRRRKKPH